MDESQEDDEIDFLLNRIFNKSSLRDLFEQKLSETGLTNNAALGILGMELRTLTGILSGTKKRVDFDNLYKLASFLQLSRLKVIQLYMEALEQNLPIEMPLSPDKIKFIKDSFNLADLKKSGFINSITDFDQINDKLCALLSLDNILEYKKPIAQVAFSAGLTKPKNENSRSLWIAAATLAFEELDNPYEYNRQALVDYFPRIRWHSTDVELGLINIIRDLYRLGVTVIYLPPFSSLHLRGATFSVDDKPSVVITNYKGFYPTLWYALVHELFHVIFDWDEIKTHQFHLSDDDDSELTVITKEREANHFARQYLFSVEKTQHIKPFLSDKEFVQKFTSDNHVHPSFAYVFSAYDGRKEDRFAWARARKESPSTDKPLAPIAFSWTSTTPIKEFFRSLKYKYYN